MSITDEQTEQIKSIISKELVSKVKKALESDNALPNLSPATYDCEGRRFYLTGLPEKVKPEVITQKMQEFGEVAYVELDDVIDEERAAFVTFKDATDGFKELTETMNELSIGGKVISIVKATPKKTQVFVGGLKPDITAEHLAMFFSEFGHVHDTMVKYDPATGISRCFGFVTFLDNDDIVHTLCKQRFFSMSGKRIEVKKAVPMSEQINIKKAQMKAAFVSEMNTRAYMRQQQNFVPKRMPRDMRRSMHAPIHSDYSRGEYAPMSMHRRHRLSSYNSYMGYPRYY